MKRVSVCYECAFAILVDLARYVLSRQLLKALLLTVHSKFIRVAPMGLVQL